MCVKIFMPVGLCRGSRKRSFKKAPGSYHARGNDDGIIFYMTSKKMFLI